jgi:tetratricopeptide (TPR) repeat protein
VDLEWAAQLREKPDLKAARARYAHALDVLALDPAADRLAAMKGMSQVLVESGKSEEAAKLLTAEAKKLPQAEARQSADVMLGALYRDSLKDPKQARAWFTRADLGDSTPGSLEAGLALVDLDANGGDAQAAAERLQALAKRDAGAGLWFVPIHYKLAVLYHGQQRLPEALDEYTAVANVTNRDTRTRYAKVIAESKEQAAAIAEYLKLTGGAPGSRIAVPQLKQSQ